MEVLKLKQNLCIQSFSNAYKSDFIQETDTMNKKWVQDFQHEQQCSFLLNI